MVINMNIEHLYYLQKVLEYQSFSLAAQNLFTSQQNLSNIVAHIEKEFNCVIFKRSRKGIKLTAEGKILMPKINNLLFCYEDCLNTFNDTSYSTKLAINTNISSTNLCFFIEDISQSNFNVTIYEEFSNKRIIDKVLRNDCTYGLLLLYHSLDAALSKKIDVHVIAEFDVCLMVPYDDPLANLDGITLEQCLSYPLILDNGNVIKEEVIDYNIHKQNMAVSLNISSIINASNFNYITLILKRHGYGIAAKRTSTQQIHQIPIIDIPKANLAVIYNKSFQPQKKDLLLFKYLEKYFNFNSNFF